MTKKLQHTKDSDDTVLDIIKKLPNDEKYFKPLTDDYAYVIEEDIRGEEASQNYGYDGIYEQFVYLYSFDENGKIVQCIYRRYHSEHLRENFQGEEFSESFKKWTFDKESGAYYIDYLAEYEGEELFSSEDSTAKEYLLYDLTRYGQHEGFYFSKP